MIQSVRRRTQVVSCNRLAAVFAAGQLPGFVGKILFEIDEIGEIGLYL